MPRHFWSQTRAFCPRVKSNLRCLHALFLNLPQYAKYSCLRPRWQLLSIFRGWGKCLSALCKNKFSLREAFHTCERAPRCCLRRNQLHPGGAGDLWAVPAPKWLLLRHGDPSPGLLSEHWVRRRLGHGGRHVARARHQTVGERDQVPAQLRPVQPWKLSPDLDWFWQRK